MIDIPDCGPGGGENRSITHAGASDAIAGPSQIVRELEAWPNTPAPTSNGEVTRNNGPQTPSAGFGPELEQALTRSPDGREAALAYLRSDLDALLTAEVQDRDAFTRYYDTLSSGVRDKALMTALKNPGLSMLELRDKVKARLTLDEAREADIWWSRLEVVPH